jgi:hypothetical protein
VGKRGSGSWRWINEEAATLRSEEVLVPPIGEVAADQFLAAAVVDGRVDQIDAGIEDGVKHLTSGFVIDSRPPAGSPQLHGPIAKNGDFGSGAAEWAGLECHSRRLARSGGAFPFGTNRNGKNCTMVLLVVLLIALIALIFAGAGFALHLLWIAAVIFALFWLVGAALGVGESAGRHRFYRW